MSAQVGARRSAGHRAPWALERHFHPQKWPSKRESQAEKRACNPGYRCVNLIRPRWWQQRFNLYRLGTAPVVKYRSSRPQCFADSVSDVYDLNSSCALCHSSQARASAAPVLSASRCCRRLDSSASLSARAFALNTEVSRCTLFICVVTSLEIPTRACSIWCSTTFIVIQVDSRLPAVTPMAMTTKRAKYLVRPRSPFIFSRSPFLLPFPRF